MKVVLWKALVFYYLVILLVAIILALFYRWISTWRIRKALKQLRNYQIKLHRCVRKLIWIYDNFALLSIGDEESWIKFLNEISKVAGDLVDLKEKATYLAVPRLLRPVQKHLIQASNSLSEHVFLITEASDTDDVINAFGGFQFKNGLNSFKIVNRTLQELVNYYQVGDMP